MCAFSTENMKVMFKYISENSNNPKFTRLFSIENKSTQIDTQGCLLNSFI